MQKLLRSGGLKALEQHAGGEMPPDDSDDEREPAAEPTEASVALEAVGPPGDVARMRAELKALRRELALLRDLLRDKSRR